MSTHSDRRFYRLPPMNTDAQLNEIMLESERPKVLTDHHLANPMLLILLGSTPALAGLEVMHQMLSLSPAERRRVAFACIDTDVPPLELISFRQEHIGIFQDFDQRISVPAYANSTTWPPPPIHTHMLIPEKMPQYFATGAGGIRNNGHVALAFNHAIVRQTLELALSSIMKISGEQDDGAINEVQVNVVVFGGGGTGSGIAPDILVMAREMLVRHGIFHRLNLFVILPEPVSGANDPDVSWRKSNSVACLLETMAHSLAAEDSPNKTYTKYLHKSPYEVGADPLANEIYLIGYTGLGDPEKIARLVGTDLFMRGCDASGVGFLEKSKWVDRRVLARKDEPGRDLTTNVGLSLPLEIIFPAHATARAFANISAAYLIDQIVGTQPPHGETSQFSSTWSKELDEIVNFEATRGAPNYVRPTEKITLDDIEGDLNRLYGDTLEHLARTAEDIKRRVDEALVQQLRRISETPSEKDDPGFPLVARRLRWLFLLKDKYDAWDKIIESAEQPPAFQRPIDLEARYDRPLAIAPGFIQKQLQPRYAQLLVDDYNDRINNNDYAERRTNLRKMVTELQESIKRAIKDQEQWYQQERIDEVRQSLYQRGVTSSAWQGKLDRDNPHQRHLFHLRSNQSAEYQERQLAVERLYLRTTFFAQKDIHTLQDAEAISQFMATRFLQPCMEFISKREAGDRNDHLDPDENAAVLQSQSKDMLSRRVVEFFEDYYLYHIEGAKTFARNAKGLMHYNLFQLIEWGYNAKTHSEIKAILIEHLKHMQSQLRTFLNFEPGLDQTDIEVDTSLYLGVRWDSREQRERVLGDACDDLGKFGSGKLSVTPKISALIDPHRLQLLYGVHGISMSVLSDFHRPYESMMSEYLKHQREWVGASRDGHIRIIFGGNGVYGKNQMPVHASEEMERLVCDFDALQHNVALHLRWTVYERVIRRAQARNSTPGWTSQQGESDTPNSDTGMGSRNSVPRR